jgi:hypothetical protein
MPKNSMPFLARSSSGNTSLAAGHERFVQKLNHQVALGDPALGHIVGHPVVRQARPGQHQVAGLELADPVADKGAPRGGGNQVQLVFVVLVPARQRRRVAVREAADETDLVGRFIA